jgi:hypothetical protein
MNAKNDSHAAVTGFSWAKLTPLGNFTICATSFCRSAALPIERPPGRSCSITAFLRKQTQVKTDRQNKCCKLFVKNPVELPQIKYLKPRRCLDSAFGNGHEQGGLRALKKDGRSNASA